MSNDPWKEMIDEIRVEQSSREVNENRSVETQWRLRIL